MIENSHNKSSSNNSGSNLDLKTNITQNAIKNNDLVKKKLKNLNIFNLKSDKKFLKNLGSECKKPPKIDKVNIKLFYIKYYFRKI